MSAIITNAEATGPLGLLRVEKTWEPIVVDDDVAGYHLTLLSAELDGEPVIWPRSAEIADTYAATDPEFRAWLDRTEP